ncbi:MAG: hypothetical protein Q7S66_05950 [bacterium]|nr:hypothetical protein [bacterium]
MMRDLLKFFFTIVIGASIGVSIAALRTEYCDKDHPQWYCDRPTYVSKNIRPMGTRTEVKTSTKDRLKDAVRHDLGNDKAQDSDPLAKFFDPTNPFGAYSWYIISQFPN